MPAGRGIRCRKGKDTDGQRCINATKHLIGRRERPLGKALVMGLYSQGADKVAPMTWPKIVQTVA